ncbi:hypothetical protein HDU85_000079 [Gaertneriomyces sp. JEL0708]|nr:hypothetical protein HDU85_000079 [Gaertneriomyces sp. JEL0708]
MRLSTRFIFFAILALAVLTVFVPSTAASAAQADVQDGAGDMKQYILSFKESATAQTLEDLIHKVEQAGGRIIHRFTVIPAMTIEIPSTLVTSFSSIAGVEEIEEDRPVSAFNDDHGL